ncbi:MAG: AAA family ATPase, partial [Bacteriovoracaceae bacterium]|nr:AAA family ATPase [Bacteriovoracaceae bacterium]
MELYPYDLKAERALLGSIIFNPNLLMEFENIEVEHFHHRPHQFIFKALVNLKDEYSNIDYVTLRAKLESQGQLEKIGGDQELMSLNEESYSSAFAEDYLRLVLDKSKAREIINTGNNIVKLGSDYCKNKEETQKKLENLMLNINNLEKKVGFIGTSPILKELLNGLADGKRKAGELYGVTTGYTEVDNLLLGLRGGQMVVLAARPSVGKSSLALCMALSAAKIQSKHVGLFSLEMSNVELMERAVAIESQVNLRRIKTKDFYETDLKQIGKAINDIEKLPLFICDQGGLSLAEIRSRAIRLKMEQGLDFLVIDYIGLIKTTGKYGSMVHEIGEISMGIKALAKELEIPILILSQLNRQIE